MADPAASDVSKNQGARTARRASILIVEDDAAMREMLREALEDDGYVVETAVNGRAGVERVKKGGIDLVVSDVKMPEIDGLDMLREIKAVSPSPHVITITAFGSIDTAIRAVKLGAFDYITKPFEVDQLILSVEKALSERELRSEVARLRDEVSRTYHFENMIGKSTAMHEVFDLVRRVAGSPASVLVTGESGTGKELVAKAIHFHSPRRTRPFVAVNCAAIPDALLESELFGYKRGAFTDARSDHAGLLVEAEGGTMFLDEIAELSPALQAKFLRVLQEREIRPLGATRNERVDVRVIAATNKELDARLKDGSFREDLYYRLNVIQIHLPALRDRAEDILPLSEHFLTTSAARAGKDIKGFHEAAKKALLAHRWPGNVRELENVVERAVALAETGTIRVDDLPAAVRDRRTGEQDTLALALARDLSLDELEREYIQRVLVAEGGNKTRAAQRLGLDRKTLYRKLEEYAARTAPETERPSPHGRGQGQGDGGGGGGGDSGDPDPSGAASS
ncbi:MAG TPA: sigma-54 dependent transcriptional regulator [Polyangia bacterium]|jgi:DNA-binding NtrC family response regulator|nr:sigma-54 dependent transcriptional regulator [Polyangia bacterium]